MRTRPEMGTEEERRSGNDGCGAGEIDDLDRKRMQYKYNDKARQATAGAETEQGDTMTLLG